MSRTAPTLAVDVSSYRLGDRMACAWWAQQRARELGQRFALIDRCDKLSQPFDLALYFPDTFEAADARCTLPHWDMGNLWLTVTAAFATHPSAGRFEHLPPAVLERAERLRREASKPRWLIHVLDDAPYNRARNWSRRGIAALFEALRPLPIELVRLNPQRGQFLGGYEEMLAQMLAADAFIGGDTGPSHVFAMLCAERPQLALYPDMSRDQARYRGEQQRLGLPLPWNSLPKRPGLTHLTLQPTRQWEWEGWRPRFHRAGHIDIAALRHWAEQQLRHS